MAREIKAALAFVALVRANLDRAEADPAHTAAHLLSARAALTEAINVLGHDATKGGL
jgi:hypothetical protein